ncbi:hypothetical protein LTR08_008757 [Meristemomyces frigidus]|nr:hypothetical protein LTR08_008757 [Meristemomyces frigidus]
MSMDEPDKPDKPNSPTGSETEEPIRSDMSDLRYHILNNASALARVQRPQWHPATDIRILIKTAMSERETTHTAVVTVGNNPFVQGAAATSIPGAMAGLMNATMEAMGIYAPDYFLDVTDSRNTALTSSGGLVSLG